MLNNIERQISETLQKRSGIVVNDTDKFTTQYYQQDNFIVCIIADNDRKILDVGVSKRNPIDSMSNDIGRKRAFNRAVKSLLRYYA